VDEDGWNELSDGGHQPIRIAAPDLQQASRIRARVRADHESVAVVLDITVAVAADFRAARTALDEAGTGHPETLRYAGTVDGLVGLIADIYTAGVADGVTLIAASPRQDLGALGRDVLGRLALRDQARAS
jgi:hypothetical protein